MKKVSGIILLIVICVQAFAQDKQEVIEELKRFKINENWLSSNLKEEDAVHAYTLTQLRGTKNGPEETVAKYDPRKKIGDRWTLITVNDAPPDKNDIKTFNKLHNPKNRGINGKIDGSSYDIIRDDEEFFVFKFRLIKESLPSKFQFLGDCDAFVYGKKDIEEITYAEFISFRPTKVKMLNVTELHVEMYFDYDEESKSYVHEEGILDMTALVFGQPQPMQMINTYSNYEVVK